ncbi:MAG: hypothetical protein KA158_04995 [Leucobacter sp.]|nr:hypothetical protein [Leucobacter sp.]
MTLDKQWMSCEVTDASVVKGGWRSSSAWSVKIASPDCEAVAIPGIASQSDAEQIADQLTSGVTFDFKLSAFSRLIADGTIPLMTASADEFRPAAASK